MPLACLVRRARQPNVQTFKRSTLDCLKVLEGSLLLVGRGERSLGVWRRDNRCFLREEGVKVRGVGLRLDHRDKRRRDRLGIQLRPVDVSKKRVVHQLLPACLARAQPTLAVFVQQLGDQVLCIRREEWWHLERLREDEPEELFVITRSERQLPRDHLEADDSHAPPVHRLACARAAVTVTSAHRVACVGVEIRWRKALVGCFADGM